MPDQRSLRERAGTQNIPPVRVALYDELIELLTSVGLIPSPTLLEARTIANKSTQTGQVNNEFFNELDRYEQKRGSMNVGDIIHYEGRQVRIEEKTLDGESIKVYDMDNDQLFWIHDVFEKTRRGEFDAPRAVRAESSLPELIEELLVALDEEYGLDNHNDSDNFVTLQIATIDKNDRASWSKMYANNPEDAAWIMSKGIAADFYDNDNDMEPQFIVLDRGAGRVHDVTHGRHKDRYDQYS
jgi:hypothetical protein